jgi:hypothetical protein
VTYINYSVTGAKAGIMIRQINTAGSANVFLSLEEQTGGANDVLFRRRSSAGGSTSTIDRDTGFNTPFWVRMVLSGAGATKTVTAYRSPDGITWTAMSSTTTISLTGNMTVGLAFSSNDPGAGEPVTARFKNVLITGGANIAPFARSQDFDSEDGLTQGVAFNGNAITDDYDPNGNSLTATKLTNPANGTITFNSDGTFIYTSNAGFVGTDSFTYRVSDGSTNSNTATISFIVTGSGSMMMAGSSSSGGSTSSTLSRSSLVGMSSNPNAQIAALTPGKSYFLSLGADAEENQVAKTNQRGDSFPANSAEHASSKSTDSKIRQMFATLFDDTENKLFGTSFLARKKFGTRT